MIDNSETATKEVDQSVIQTKILKAQTQQLAEMSLSLQRIEKYVRLFYILAMITIVLFLLGVGLVFFSGGLIALQSCH